MPHLPNPIQAALLGCLLAVWASYYSNDDKSLGEGITLAGVILLAVGLLHVRKLLSHEGEGRVPNGTLVFLAAALFMIAAGAHPYFV